MLLLLLLAHVPGKILDNNRHVECICIALQESYYQTVCLSVGLSVCMSTQTPIIYCNYRRLIRPPLPWYRRCHDDGAPIMQLTARGKIEFVCL